jgi:hypothetical protein
MIWPSMPTTIRHYYRFEQLNGCSHQPGDGVGIPTARWRRVDFDGPPMLPNPRLDEFTDLTCARSSSGPTASGRCCSSDRRGFDGRRLP